MTPLILEWISKAEGDFQTATRELRARKNPNYDAVCYHAQQCAEKYLKTLLQVADIPFGKTHNLIGLLQLLLPVHPMLEAMRPQLDYLNAFASQIRYPGESADKATAQQAMKHCGLIRSEVRSILPLDL